jgi:hypothetical protein
MTMTDDKNRDHEPCPDGECKHAYDDCPAGSVTQRDREIYQCSRCGWTAQECAARTIPVPRSDSKGCGPDELALKLEQVAELHRQLGAWLEANRCRQ